jgi:hypothetical protein
MAWLTWPGAVVCSTRSPDASYFNLTALLLLLCLVTTSMPSQTLQRELSASPLKPKVPIASKSENSLSFDVWKLLAEMKLI